MKEPEWVSRYKREGVPHPSTWEWLQRVKTKELLKQHDRAINRETVKSRALRRKEGA